MFSESAALYDAIYAVFKDYAEEAAAVSALLGKLNPKATSILDVACGTGEHARLLRENHGFEVDGLDLDDQMIELAAAKNPAGRFVVGDMVHFNLHRRYDAVLCLFSSIGYVRSLDNLSRALVSMSRHLAEAGVLVVEPWFAPDRIEAGRTSIRTAETPEAKVSRMSRITVHGRVSRLEFEYLVGTDSGIRRASEIHELGLFTVNETTAAFREAGLEVDHDEVGLSGRGLFVGRRRGESK